MSQTTKIVMTADDQGVLAALLKQAQSADRLADKLDRVGKSGKRGSEAVQSGFNQAGSAIKSAAGQIAGFGSALGGVAALIGVIKQEMAEIRRRNEEARMAQMTAGEAVRGVRMNFNEDESLKDADLEKRLMAVARNTRTPIGTVAAAFSSAASARGSLTNAQAMQATEAALQMMPGDLETGTQIGSRALDLMKLQAGATPQAAVGYLSGVQAASRVTDTARLGKHAAPAIAAMVAGGGTIEQGGELYAAISNLLQDAEGAISGTAQKNLVSQLTGFVPGANGNDARGKFAIPAEQMAAFEGAANPMARMAALQQNPELRRDFMARNSFAAESRTAIERLLSGEAGAMKELSQAQQTVLPLGPQTAKIFQDRLGRAERGQFQPVLTAEQRTVQLADDSRLNNTMGARREASRKVLESALDSSGDSWLKRELRLSAFEAAAGKNPRGPESAAGGILQARLREVDEWRAELQANPQGSASQIRRADDIVASLQESINILKDLRDDSRRRDPPAQRREPAAAALGRR